MIKIEGDIVPKNQYVVCRADVNQKKHHQIPGTDIDLYIENKFNENLRERNPNYAEVAYVSDSPDYEGYEPGRVFKNKLSSGDNVCVQHFQIVDHNGNSNAFAVDKDGNDLFLVDIREVYFRDNGGTPETCSNYILCEREDLVETTESGIIIPETIQDEYRRGTSRAVVRYTSDQLTYNIKPGDVILFIKYADYELTYGGKTYLKLAEDEIMGVFGNNE